MSLYSLLFSSRFFHMTIYAHTGPHLIFTSASWSHQCQDYTSHCLMRVSPRVTWHRHFCCSYNEYEFLSRHQGQWVLSSDSGPTFHHSSPTLTLDTLMFPRFAGKPCSLFPEDTRSTQLLSAWNTVRQRHACVIPGVWQTVDMQEHLKDGWAVTMEQGHQSRSLNPLQSRFF